MKSHLFQFLKVRPKKLQTYKYEIIDTTDMSLTKLQEIVKDKGGVLQSMQSQRVGHNLETEQQPPK